MTWERRENLCVATALVGDKQVKGTFFKGSDVKEVRHNYTNIRKTLQEKRRLDVVSRLSRKETKR
ncbi:MAG: hypothetical protein ACP5T2_06460, partial [Thermoprotei archaeon]